MSVGQHRRTGARRSRRSLDQLQAVRVDRAAQLPRPRRHPAVRAVPHRRGRRGAGAHLPAARARLRAVPARPDPPADHARGDVHRVRLLLLLLHVLGASTPAGSSTSAIERLDLGADSFVVEVASNDGYLLQHFVRALASAAWAWSRRSTSARPRGRRACPRSPRSSPRRPAGRCASSTARPTWSASTTSTPTSPTSSASPRACGRMVADDGWVSIEVQHLLTLVEHTQFDTVYHEHFQYYTVLTGQRALASGGLTLVDVELLPTHGGSIRMWARPTRGRGRAEPGRARRAGRRDSRRACTPPRATTGSPRPSPACATTWSRS